MMEHNTKAAILNVARNAGTQWARNRATVTELREGAFPYLLLADLVSWPCDIDEVTEAFKAGARVGMTMRNLPDRQLPGQPPQPFKAEW